MMYLVIAPHYDFFYLTKDISVWEYYHSWIIINEGLCRKSTFNYGNHYATHLTGQKVNFLLPLTRKRCVPSQGHMTVKSRSALST